MRADNISGTWLAVIIAGATLTGGVASSAINKLWGDAGTERQTDVQLVQLAIGVLSAPLPEGETRSARYGGETSQTALREWAVDTINQSAEVKFDENARNLLVRGKASFPVQASKANLEDFSQAIDRIERLTREPYVRPEFNDKVIILPNMAPE